MTRRARRDDAESDGGEGERRPQHVCDADAGRAGVGVPTAARCDPPGLGRAGGWPSGSPLRRHTLTADRNEAGCDQEFVTARLRRYTLPFGGLLLVGGRISDLFGRPRPARRRLDLPAITVSELVGDPDGRDE
jgi:hypothetical protein